MNEQKTHEEYLEMLLEKTFIDPNKDYSDPPLMTVSDGDVMYELLPSACISVIIGKNEEHKRLAAMALVASVLGTNDAFVLSKNANRVLIFDNKSIFVAAQHCKSIIDTLPPEAKDDTLYWCDTHGKDVDSIWNEAKLACETIRPNVIVVLAPNVFFRDTDGGNESSSAFVRIARFLDSGKGRHVIVVSPQKSLDSNPDEMCTDLQDKSSSEFFVDCVNGDAILTLAESRSLRFNGSFVLSTINGMPTMTAM